MRALKFILLIGAALLLSVMVFFSFIYTGPTSTIQPSSALNQEELVAKGAYLARIGDCMACHTNYAQDGAEYAGGLPIKTPMGNVYATNITSDEKTGIGTYSLQDFDNAMRYGIRKDGAGMYPAMPYPSFSIVSDEDIEALYVYFMEGVEPIDRHNTLSDIPWPLSMRWPLTAWRMLYAPAVEPRF